MPNIEPLFWADGDTDWGDEFRALIRTLNAALDTAAANALDPLAHIANDAIPLAKLSAAVRASLAKADVSLDQTAVDTRARAMITEWVGAAPGTLDTLLELANRITTEATDLDALQATVTTITSGKADKASPTFTGTVTVPNLVVTGTVSLVDGSLTEADIANLVGDLAARVRVRTAWTVGVNYAVNDLVPSGSVYFLCLVAHTSSGTAPTASAPGANWATLGGGSAGGVQPTQVRGLVLQNSDGTWPTVRPAGFLRVEWERTVLGSANDPAAMGELDTIFEPR